MTGTQIFKLEELHFQMERLANMGMALHDAMFYTEVGADNYEAAMFLFYSLLTEQSHELKALYEAVCQNCKEGA